MLSDNASCCIPCHHRDLFLLKLPPTDVYMLSRQVFPSLICKRLYLHLASMIAYRIFRSTWWTSISSPSLKPTAQTSHRRHRTPHHTNPPSLILPSMSSQTPSMSLLYHLLYLMSPLRSPLPTPPSSVDGSTLSDKNPRQPPSALPYLGMVKPLLRRQPLLSQTRESRQVSLRRFVVAPFIIVVAQPTSPTHLLMEFHRHFITGSSSPSARVSSLCLVAAHTPRNTPLPHPHSLACREMWNRGFPPKPFIPPDPPPDPPPVLRSEIHSTNHRHQLPCSASPLSCHDATSPLSQIGVSPTVAINSHQIQLTHLKGTNQIHTSTNPPAGRPRPHPRCISLSANSRSATPLSPSGPPLLQLAISSLESFTTDQHRHWFKLFQLVVTPATVILPKFQHHQGYLKVFGSIQSLLVLIYKRSVLLVNDLMLSALSTFWNTDYPVRSVVFLGLVLWNLLMDFIKIVLQKANGSFLSNSHISACYAATIRPTYDYVFTSSTFTPPRRETHERPKLAPPRLWLLASPSIPAVDNTPAVDSALDSAPTSTHQSTSSALMAVGIAFKAVIETASRLEIHHLRVFSDSHSLVSLIISNGDVNELKSVLHGILCLLETFSSIFVSFISCTTNVRAYSPAKTALISVVTPAF